MHYRGSAGVHQIGQGNGPADGRIRHRRWNPISRPARRPELPPKLHAGSLSLSENVTPTKKEKKRKGKKRKREKKRKEEKRDPFLFFLFLFFFRAHPHRPEQKKAETKKRRKREQREANKKGPVFLAAKRRGKKDVGVWDATMSFASSAET